MARWRWLLSAALAASAMSNVATVEAQEKEQDGNDGSVSIDDIPGPARDEILREVGSGWLMGVYQETWHGQPAYRGRVYKGSRTVNLLVDAEGNILERHLVSMVDEGVRNPYRADPRAVSMLGW